MVWSRIGLSHLAEWRDSYTASLLFFGGLFILEHHFVSGLMYLSLYVVFLVSAAQSTTLWGGDHWTFSSNLRTISWWHLPSSASRPLIGLLLFRWSQTIRRFKFVFGSFLSHLSCGSVWRTSTFFLYFLVHSRRHTAVHLWWHKAWMLHLCWSLSCL